MVPLITQIGKNGSLQKKFENNIISCILWVSYPIPKSNRFREKITFVALKIIIKFAFKKDFEVRFGLNSSLRKPHSSWYSMTFWLDWKWSSEKHPKTIFSNGNLQFFQFYLLWHGNQGLLCKRLYILQICSFQDIADLIFSYWNFCCLKW